jgi:hypothetical protein
MAQRDREFVGVIFLDVPDPQARVSLIFKINRAFFRNHQLRAMTFSLKYSGTDPDFFRKVR